MWAQITQDKDALATGVIVFAAVVWIANQVKTFMSKPPVKEVAAGEEPVRSDYFAKETLAVREAMAREVILIRAEITKEILAVKEVSHEKRQQLASRIDDLAKDQSEQNTAARKDIHEMRGGIHEIQLRIERQYREMEQQNRKQFDELMQRAAGTDLKLERITALLEKEGKISRHED